MDAVKRNHIDDGYGWNEQLSLASRRFHASTSRGMGPSRQSAPLDVEKLAALYLNKIVVGPTFPALPGCVATICSFWLLRDLEATTAEFQDVRIDDDAMKATLQLSMSENDPRALGCERSWGCTCEGLPTSAACP